MQKIAEQRGGAFLSKEYTDSNERYLWQCSKGHIWEAVATQVKNEPTWCPYCSGRKLTIENMHILASQYGGKCLSKKYIDCHTKLRWRCAKGHIWQAPPTYIKSKPAWCPYCSSRRHLTIDDMRQLAARRNGKCLSKKYVDTKTKLKWRCLDGHTWWARPGSIKSDGHWCPECAHENLRHKRGWRRALRKPSARKVPWEI